MIKSPFHYTNFFEETGIYSEMFSVKENMWEVLPMINDFISGFRNTREFSDYTEISKNIFVGKNVTIDDKAKILDGAIIGENSTIGHAAFLRGGVLLGNNVHIGHATEVKHSIILSSTALAHLNYAGDSIVGSGVNVSGGAKLANWRFDKKPIRIVDRSNIYETGLEKCGSFIGDGGFIGVNSVINPGTVLARDCLVYPLVSVKGTHLKSLTFK